jgi:hypothetical protein
MKWFYQNIQQLGLLMAVLFGFSFLTQAQTAVFSANASANRIGDKDQVQVDYTIQNVQNMRSFIQPQFKDFDVVAGSPFSQQSSNISVIGNKVVQTQSITYSYILQPKHTGTLAVPPAQVKDADGHTYQSNGLNIEVVSGSLARQRQQQAQPFDPFDDPFVAMARQRQAMMQRQMQPQAQPNQRQQPVQQEETKTDVGNDLFIRVNVDKNKVHIGEQITASYKLYARIPMNVNISKLPSLNGFWTQDFERPKGNIPPTEEVVNGKKYQVFLLKKSALFAQQEGTLMLDPAEAEGTARIISKTKQRNPFADMFDDPVFQQFGSLMMSDPFFNDDAFSSFAYKEVPVKLKSEAVKISVLPLPSSKKPKEFGNAVGQFSITGKIDKTNTTTDDALTYTLTITGSGNLKLIEAPNLNLPNGLNTYDPQIIDTITGRTTTISGSKIITYSITPNIPGDYEIPAVPFSYYNPQTGSYVSLTTEPVKIHVEKGKHFNQAVTQKQIIADIHPIVTKPLTQLQPESKPLFFTVGYWTSYTVPLLAFIGLTFYKKREEELSKDVVKLRNRRANKVALKRLKTAEKLLQQQAKQPFYEEISKALWLYLSDKLNIPLASLSREKAFAVLRMKNVQASLQQRLEQTIVACETALYAPTSSSEMKQTYTEAVDIISKLEETV